MLRDSLQQLTEMDGFGEKSVANLLDSIEKSRTTEFVPFIHALSIPNIGKGQAKALREYLLKEYPMTHEITCAGKPISLWGALVQLVWEDFDFATSVNGFGSVLAKSITDYIQINVIGPEKITGEGSAVLNLLEEVQFTDQWLTEDNGKSAASPVSGKTFVITGKVNHFDNREALQAYIESLGGKASGSVSKNTDYLINNDKDSTSGKNKKAKELGIPVISEEDFLAMVQG